MHQAGSYINMRSLIYNNDGIKVQFFFSQIIEEAKKGQINPTNTGRIDKIVGGGHEYGPASKNLITDTTSTQ